MYMKTSKPSELHNSQLFLQWLICTFSPSLFLKLCSVMRPRFVKYRGLILIFAYTSIDMHIPYICFVFYMDTVQKAVE